MIVANPPHKKTAYIKPAYPKASRRTSVRSSAYKKNEVHTEQEIPSPSPSQKDIQILKEREKEIQEGNAVWIPATPELFEDIKRRGRERAKAKNLL